MSASLENRPEGIFAILASRQKCMWQRELFFSEGGQGLVDNRERLVYLLVFY